VVNRVAPLLAIAVLCQPPSESAAGITPIQITLPQGVDSESCEFSTGGYGGSLLKRPGRLQYQFDHPQIHDGSTVAAYVRCSGYQVVPLQVTASAVEQRIPINLTPLPTLRFAGVIRGWATPEPAMVVSVAFWPEWICSFFHLADCMLGGWRIDTSPIAIDGTFVVRLPDFAADPIVGSFAHPGRFGFSIRDSKTANQLFELAPDNTPSIMRQIEVRRSYPIEPSFHLEPVR
jgi:hypothetical protein